MADEPDELNVKQDRAMLALLTNPTIAQAARKSGIGERTLYTWLAEPGFAAAYRGARRAAVQHGLARLQQASSSAVDVLCQVMKNKRAPAATRVAAARTVLDMAIKAVELEDMSARLDALEQQVKRKH